MDLRKAQKAAAQKRYSKTEKYRIVMRRWYRKLRTLCIEAYAGKPAHCQCDCDCREDRVLLLEIDHINGDGGKHRKDIGGGERFYLWLKRNSFPPGYKVLCPNCHTAKHVYGKCEKSS